MLSCENLQIAGGFQPTTVEGGGVFVGLLQPQWQGVSLERLLGLARVQVIYVLCLEQKLHCSCIVKVGGAMAWHYDIGSGSLESSALGESRPALLTNKWRLS
jgi:hypothetical protein